MARPSPRTDTPSGSPRTSPPAAAGAGADVLSGGMVRDLTDALLSFWRTQRRQPNPTEWHQIRTEILRRHAPGASDDA